MRSDTVFDAASLNKSLAVWASSGALWEEDELALGSPLGPIWPKVEGHPLRAAAARHLLTHTVGVPLGAQLTSLCGTDPQDVCDGFLHEVLHRPPGEAVEYTDRVTLILGYLVEHLSGQRFDQLAEERTWYPPGHGLHLHWPTARRIRRAVRADRTGPGHRHSPQGRHPRLLRTAPGWSVRQRWRFHRP
ncbi:serine hydrolase domain-containing protein [Streptomyces rimosus]|uniref:serine hydrolase domain-containing protein n=1 Tax=Streptomyces rimosus TaxID=1927 RepID=UPI000995E95D